MKSRITYVWWGLLFALIVALAGCDSGGDGPTGPSTPPQLSDGGTATPNPANAGATIVLAINFIDVSGKMNDGTAFITDNQGNSYQGRVSNAEGTSGTLTTSFQLSVLVQPGEVILSVFVQNRDGTSSNTVYIPLTVS